MDTEQRNESSAGIAFLQGLAVGACAALLLTPRTGKEFREQLRTYAQGSGETLRRAAAKGKQVAREVTTAAQKAMERERQLLKDDASEAEKELA